MIRKNPNCKYESRSVLYNNGGSYASLPSWYTMNKLLLLNLQDLPLDAQLPVSLLLKFELY